ncbi:hypothetical protein [Francisella sp. SYW-9]|uniref:hypothetical protein n=1 Tax=Francisella sp. SYW-9 TaxID=2610888 RepID=UPI00123D31CC|nr:hypothetical protein [Francisella sp. SYW-9]
MKEPISFENKDKGNYENSYKERLYSSTDLSYNERYQPSNRDFCMKPRMQKSFEDMEFVNGVGYFDISSILIENGTMEYDCFRALQRSLKEFDYYQGLPVDLILFNKRDRWEDDFEIEFLGYAQYLSSTKNAQTLYIVKNLPPNKEYPENVINDSFIEGYPKNDGEISHQVKLYFKIKKLLEKITRHLIKVKLQNLITRSVENYIGWSKNLSIMSIFKHGESGRRRASALKREAYNATSAQEVVNAITSFFNNTIRDEFGKKISGSINTNNHSFISFFLNELKKEALFIRKILVPDLEISSPKYNRIKNNDANYTMPGESIERKDAKECLSKKKEINIKINPQGYIINTKRVEEELRQARIRECLRQKKCEARLRNELSRHNML